MNLKHFLKEKIFWKVLFFIFLSKSETKGDDSMLEKSEKIKIFGFDGISGMSREADDTVILADLSELYEFQNHPFRVLDDDKMKDLASSIKEYGVLTPGIVRPRNGGGYEIISGHRRKRASEIAGKTKMPVFCRNYTDEEAVVIMVDSNLQREELLPSEKAFAYKMKYEAMRKQKKRGDGKSLKTVGIDGGDNQKTVQRYIWLTRLNKNILSMVDSGELGMNPALEISFMSKTGQDIVDEVICEYGIKIKLRMSKQLRAADKERALDRARAEEIMLSIRKPRQNLIISGDFLDKYFPEEYSEKEIRNVIEDMLKNWSADSYMDKLSM